MKNSGCAPQRGAIDLTRKKEAFNGGKRFLTLIWWGMH